MRDRATGVGAELIIHTEPDHGTQVIITVPVGGAHEAFAPTTSPLPETFLA